MNNMHNVNLKLNQDYIINDIIYNKRVTLLEKN